MKYKELGKLNNNSLQDKLVQYKKEYFNLRFQKVLGELNNTSRVKKVRKSIARIYTAINTRVNE